MIVVKAPNHDYTGVTAGLTFIQGEARAHELDPHIRDWLQRKGYEVIETDPGEEPQEEARPSRRRKEA